MVTVYRANGLRVVIYTDDHDPAHVHVFGSGQTKINLFDCRGDPDLVWADNMTKAEIHEAMRIVTTQQGMLLCRWESIHGRFTRN